MFDQEQSDAFVLALEGMKNAAFPSLSFAPFWSGMSSSTISAPPGGGPHERGDIVLVCRVLVGHDGLSDRCVSTLESPVERCGFDYPSSPSRVQ